VSGGARCLVIDGQPIVRLGIRHSLEKRYEVEETGCAEDALQLLTDIGDFEVAIVDMRRGSNSGSGSMSGAAAIRALLKAQPGLGIVALGDYAERHLVREAIAAGAIAYVAKSSPTEELGRAVEAAADAERFVDPAATGVGRIGSGRALTKRQREILQLVADGNSTPQVARCLGLSTETVKTHTKQLLARLEARDRAHAVAIGLRSSLID
jgi:DNA-binding NarL/FixJ family response regulator